MLRRFAILALIAACGACERTITEGDVFLPEKAPSLILSVSDDTGVLIDRNRPRPGLFEEAGVVFEEGRADTPAGRIMWRVARQNDPDKPLIVNCHGNAGDIENHGDLTVWKLFEHGDVFMWDYPGYGASEGTARVEDFEAAVEGLSQALPAFRRDAHQPVVFWGYSFGGFICARLAARSGLADAVVFEASALSAEAAVSELTPAYASLLVRPKLDRNLQGYDNAAALSGLKAPILVLSGGKDRVLPLRQSRRLWRALVEAGLDARLETFEEADHFTIAFSDDFDDRLNMFLIEMSLAEPTR